MSIHSAGDAGAAPFKPYCIAIKYRYEKQPGEQSQYLEIMDALTFANYPRSYDDEYGVDVIKLKPEENPYHLCTGWVVASAADELALKKRRRHKGPMICAHAQGYGPRGEK